MRTGKLNVARREMHIARANENNMRNQLRARVDHLKTENAYLRRLIKEVAIPALSTCLEHGEYHVFDQIPPRAVIAPALVTLQEGVK